jgi:hypothetical protein
MNIPRIGFLYDCNSQNLTALQVLNVTLQNPVGSGKRIIIEGYAIPNSSNIAAMGSLIHMPDTNLPTTAYAPLPYNVKTDISSPGNVGIFKANVALIVSGALGGGTSIISVPVKPADRNYIEAAPLVLDPGVIMGWKFAPGVILAGFTFAVYTREETI